MWVSKLSQNSEPESTPPWLPTRRVTERPQKGNARRGLSGPPCSDRDLGITSPIGGSVRVTSGHSVGIGRFCGGRFRPSWAFRPHPSHPVRSGSVGSGPITAAVLTVPRVLGGIQDRRFGCLGFWLGKAQTKADFPEQILS